MYTIARARHRDVDYLTGIELAAARLLVGFAPESVLTEATPMVDFLEALSRGHLWVALVDDAPVGFAHVKILEGRSVHLDELDVHPDYGRRGIGRALLTAVCDWAGQRGERAVTLSTFREPKWNMPFYASFGFEEVARTDLSPAMKRVVADEARRGLVGSRRVIMRMNLELFGGRRHSPRSPTARP